MVTMNSGSASETIAPSEKTGVVHTARGVSPARSSPPPEPEKPIRISATIAAAGVA